jgi:hypothetical protein
VGEQYLLVAEVDKIQSFVWRSARRKEVVGGSYLLNDFCQKVKDNSDGFITPPPVEVLTSSGGSFRLVFTSEGEAVRAGQSLRLKFEQKVGGTITIAGPVKYSSVRPEAGLAEGYDALRRAKTAGHAPVPVWDMPLHATCSSCGSAPSITFGKQHDDDPRARYLCGLCREKAVHAEDGMRSLTAGLLSRLGDVRLYPNAAEAETYAQGFDERGYVAYLLADGNGMGATFSQVSDPATLKQFSHDLTELTEQALAEGLEGILHQSYAEPDCLPAMPLILGGDDVLLMLPAPWALDVAARYANAWERIVTDYLNNTLKMPDAYATTGVAVVICKATYPYRLAYEHGDDALGKAKDMGKNSTPPRSMVSAGLILGSQLPSAQKRSLRPSSAGKSRSLILGSQSPSSVYAANKAHEAREAGLLSVQSLLDWRFALRNLSRSLFKQVEQVLSAGDDPREVVTRAATFTQSGAEQLSAALNHLGDDSFVELIKLWDFTYSLGHEIGEYTQTE